MNVGELVLISLALALDAATYAFAYGLALRERRRVSALLLAATVGVFQAGMPLLGYMGGLGLRAAVQAWGQWLVFGVFVALGGSVIYKAWWGKEEEQSMRPLGLAGLALVGLATSMDAFVVGICMALGHVIGEQLSAAQLAAAVCVIGATTFAAALSFFYLSALLHRLPERLLQTLAGAVLVALGVNALC